MLPLKTLRVLLPIFIIFFVPAKSQLCQKCDQTISGRNFNYADVLEIIQDEDYLEEADFDDIRRHRYKRHLNISTIHRISGVILRLQYFNI